MSTIYGLIKKSEPGRIRYIGQTSQLINKRLTQHRYHSKTLMKNTPVGKWIRKYRNEIEIVVLKENAEWNIDEIKFIKEYRSLETNLLNICNGGSGNQKDFITQEHKEAISSKLTGVAKTKEHCKNISNGRKGIKFSNQHKNNLVKSHIGNNSAKGSVRSKQLREQVAIKKGSKPFIVLCKETGKKIGQWINKNQCALDLGIHKSSVHNVLSGWASSTKHYNFKYVEGNI